MLCRYGEFPLYLLFPFSFSPAVSFILSLYYGLKQSQIQHSVLWLGSTPKYFCGTFFKIHLSVQGNWVASISCDFNCFKCDIIINSQRQIPLLLYIFPVVAWLCHIVDPFLDIRCFILSSIIVVLVYIPTYSGTGYLFPCILTNMYHVLISV